MLDERSPSAPAMRDAKHRLDALERRQAFQNDHPPAEPTTITSIGHRGWAHVGQK